MARRKIKLAWIANDSARKSTFKKRKKGLIKKVEQLSILCDVDACVIIDSPYEPQTEVWPSSDDVRRVVLNFKSLPEMERCRKMVNQEGFLRQRIMKLRDQLKRQQRENREAEISILMSECLVGKGLHGVCIEDLNDLAWMVEAKLKLVQKRIETIQNSNSLQEATTTMTMMQEVKMREAHDETMKIETSGLEVVGMEMEPLQKQPWFMEPMNPHEYMVFGGEEMVMPFGDSISWSDGCFPQDFHL
ncbi:agamous-like MADS-box protein AGL80 [Magnolia sinica]|uniref:agamous-like MADS-box protein AGL80 n=1 Tax=Magnolia sinica TaxID=86752 RepID=UPI002659735C|nr:agamous-like MADS-box protein AGL80 [Magnolia sinica]